MLLGKYLSEFEKDQIAAFHDENLTIAEIASRLNRSRKVVSNFLNLREKYGKNKSPGRPKVVNEREKRAVLRKISNSTKGVRHVRDELLPAVSHMSVWRLINSSPNIGLAHCLVKYRAILLRTPCSKNVFNRTLLLSNL